MKARGYWYTSEQKSVSHLSAQKITDNIPTGCYSISYNKVLQKYELLPIVQPTLPNKVYGNLEDKCEKVLTTYKDRTENEHASTGVLYSGNTGSGKTLSVKYLIRKLLSMDIPCITVEEPFCGSQFADFIQNIKQEVCFIFDEFEKVYNKAEDQTQMLGILDGVSNAKGKLFLFTINDTGKILKYFTNRPNRIIYHFKYKDLDPKVAKQFLDDNLEEKLSESYIQRLVFMLPNLNMDCISNAAKEAKRYSCSFAEALASLNLDEVSAQRFEATILDETIIAETGSTTIDLFTLKEEEVCCYSFNKEDVPSKYRNMSYSKLSAMLDSERFNGEIKNLKRDWIEIQFTGEIELIDYENKEVIVKGINNLGKELSVKLKKVETKHFTTEDMTKLIA